MNYKQFAIELLDKKFKEKDFLEWIKTSDDSIQKGWKQEALLILTFTLKLHEHKNLLNYDAFSSKDFNKGRINKITSIDNFLDLKIQILKNRRNRIFILNKCFFWILFMTRIKP